MESIMASGFVDFAAIKKAVSIEQVLDRYKLLETLTGDGAQRKGPDPFGFATAGKSKPFAVNLDKNVWTLFRGSEQLSGNVIDFVMEKERCNVRQAAVKLAGWFSVGSSAPRIAEKPRQDNTRTDSPAKKTGVDENVATDSNAPLGFQLKGLDPHHEALSQFLFAFGLHSSTLEDFGAGYYTGNGKAMKGRLAVPIERRGVCVGYCGVDNNPEAPELFKFPDKWVHGVEIYNFTRALSHAEGALRRGDRPEWFVFRDIVQVWQAIQLGYPCSVAVMGECITPPQFELLRVEQVLSRFPVALQLHVEGGLI